MSIMHGLARSCNKLKLLYIYYISTATMPMATILGTVGIYNEELLSKKSQGSLVTCSLEDQVKY